MSFGGIHKNSLIDYPGKISCVLFLQGCNFNCPYCHNPSLVGETNCQDNETQKIDENKVIDFLESRRNFLDGVVITGGEPTLHESELKRLCNRIKDIGYPVKIDTNGSRPSVLQSLIDEALVDYIAMDIKTAPFQYASLIGRGIKSRHILESIGVIRGSSLPHEFRTTCVRTTCDQPLVDDQIIETIAMLIQGADLYALQQFQKASVLHPEFFQGGDCRFTDEDLGRFQKIAERWVKRCIVR